MFPRIEAMYTAAAANNMRVGQVFEEVAFELYAAFVSCGDVVMDIGAHNGLHTVPLSRCVGWRGKVVAIEPIPEKFTKLKRRLRKKRIWNTSLHRKAISQKEGMADFHYFPGRPAFSGLRERGVSVEVTNGEPEKISVKCRSLDSFKTWFRRVSLIKLDIEGGEFDALCSGKGLIKSHRPFLFFENGKADSAKAYGYSKEDFFGLFEELDYHLFYISGDAFTVDRWDTDDRCWDYVALPAEKAHLCNVLQEKADGVTARLLAA